MKTLTLIAFAIIIVVLAYRAIYYRPPYVFVIKSEQKKLMRFEDAVLESGPLTIVFFSGVYKTR